MQRFAILASLFAVLALGLIGCGSSSTTQPASLSVTPWPMSLNFGQAVTLTVTPLNSSGTAITTSVPTITYSVAPGSSATVSVTNNGNVCAGTWDPLNQNCCEGTWNSNYTLCSPPSQDPPSGTATINIASGSATFSDQVYVHPKVMSIVITSPSGGIPLSSCLTQNQQVTFTAAACSPTGPGNPTLQSASYCPSGQGDITSTIGNFTWSLTAPQIAILDQTGQTCSYGPTCKLTAQQVGQSLVSATVSGATSSPVVFTTCPAVSLALTDSSGNTSSSVASGGQVALSATPVDTKNNVLTGLTLTYSSTLPAAITAGSTLTGVDPGTSNAMVSCTPPGCNPAVAGQLPLGPIYGNVPYAATVTGSSSTTIFAASTTSTDLAVIGTSGVGAGGNTYNGTPVTLTSAPNSIMANSSGTEILLGSNSGLMVVNASSYALTTNTSVTGQVLAISPDGNTAVVSNASLGTLSLYSISGNTVKTYSFPGGATNAAFSIDTYRGIAVGPQAIATWVAGGVPVVTNVNTASDVDFLPQGSLAYLVGGSPSVRVVATCDYNDLTSSAAITGTTSPKLIRGVPFNPPVNGITNNTFQMLAVDPPNLDVITVGLPGGGAATVTPTTNCDPTLTNTEKSVNIGAGSTPDQLLVTPNGSTAFIMDPTQAQVLLYTVNGGTASTVAISGSVNPADFGTSSANLPIPDPYVAAMTMDSSFLYFAATDGQIHRINLTNSPANDDAQIGGLPFTPNLIAVRWY